METSRLRFTKDHSVPATPHGKVDLFFDKDKDLFVWKDSSGNRKSFGASDIPIQSYNSDAEAYAAGVPPYGLYRKPDGSIVSVMPDAQAQAYQSASGISNEAMMRLSGFYKGLDTLGLRANLVDGAAYTDDMNAMNGTSLRSLKSVINLTTVGGPTQRPNGIYFNGAGQYAVGDTPAVAGARSFIGFNYAALDNVDNRSQVIFQLRNIGTAAFLGIQTAGGANNGQIASFAVGGTVRIITDTSWGRNPKELTVPVHPYPSVTTGLIKQGVRDDALATATSFSSMRYGGMLPFTRQSMQGEASYSMNQLRICVTGNATLSTIDHTTERIIPGWLYFNKALTDAEELAVMNLVDITLIPRFRFIWEGDSITNDMRQRAIGKAFWNGANVDWYDIWEGGQTAANAISQLGTDLGLNDTNLGGNFPKIAFIAFGTNDVGNPAFNNKSVETFHSELRTLWAYARARGAKVIANTVFQSVFITDNGREADRIALNELIRKDAGIYYDVLLDRDAWINAATNVRPIYNDLDMIRPGGVHLNLNPGKGSDLLTQYMSDQLLNLGLLP